MTDSEGHVAQQAEQVRRSADTFARTAGRAVDSADRRTELAADRTVLAAERTYAAWVRTGLAALASGVGAKALLSALIPGWLTLLTGSILVIFSMVCFAAAVWREMDPGAPPPKPDTRRLPKALLVGLNGFLILVDLAVLVGIWLGPDNPLGVRP
jgi:putative membrane protein